jgi:hypothetical protein
MNFFSSQNFVAHSEEDDEERITQMIERVEKDALWVLAKVIKILYQCLINGAVLCPPYPVLPPQAAVQCCVDPVPVSAKRICISNFFFQYKANPPKTIYDYIPSK